MVFSSTIFLFFFLPLVIMGYYLLKEKFRIYFLLLASLFFYAWGEPRYIRVMLISIAVNYIYGILIHISKTGKPALTKILLFAAILCNIAVLFYFKYLDFTIFNLNRFFHTNFPLRHIVMPIGISFFTFQGMSYVIDLYRDKVPVQKNPALMAFYISFFPQLIAGPIVRYIDIEKQIYAREETVEKFACGVKRFITGLAKKLVIANTLGYAADRIFANNPVENTAATAWLGIICYSFQIYYDFSGYSDMAIGLGKMFGFEFLENFNYPYISKSLTEFWRRWHISLSSWFRDYVYIPLGGNRKGNVYENLFIVFFITGLWHGAGFNFIAWGLWHGLFLVVERLFHWRDVKSPRFVPLRYLLTMLIVMIGWVFFRAPGLRAAGKYLGIMFGLIRPENVGYSTFSYLTSKTGIALMAAFVFSFPLSKIPVPGCFQNTYFFKNLPNIFFLFLFLISAIFVVSSSYNPFIYFRF
jgi:alginate O-acetyltransferase complex protein AlgI